MTSSGSVEPAASGATSGAEQQLRQEIEQTREQIGDTVEALTAKADVKARAQAWLAARAGALRERLAGTTAQDRQQAAAAAAITLIAGYLVTRIWRKR
jgi:Protein of unknown function (DUF3618)